MRLAVAIGTAWGTASVLAALLVGRVIAAGNRLAAPPAEVPLLFDALDAPHPQPCIEPVWAVLDGEKRLSLVPLSDGRMAVFAADLEDFVGLTLDRSAVQRMRHELTTWLCATARQVSL